MVGIDSQFDQDELVGDASITYDFTQQDVDLAFTNIQTAQETDRTYADLQWDNVPVIDGSFQEGMGPDSLAGHFFGPNAEEMSGIFERNNLVGAFGAKR